MEKLKQTELNGLNVVPVSVNHFFPGQVDKWALHFE